MVGLYSFYLSLLTGSDMTRIFYLFSLFVVLMIGPYSLKATELPSSDLQRLEEVYIFSGDDHGDFSGDLAVVLSDGSAWKIHPDSVKKFRRWGRGEIVHVDVRSSFYWFKREHKFKLYNHQRKESVKAMLVAHIDPPLAIVDTYTYPTDIMLVPHYERDFNGNDYIAYYQEVPINFEKLLYLNDGSIWKIASCLNSFNTGMKVYRGAADRATSFFYFLISGLQREAVWTSASPYQGN